MSAITGDLVLVTDRPAAVTHVWVRSQDLRTAGGKVIIPASDQVRVVDGKVSFTCVPGIAILGVMANGIPLGTYPILVPDAPSADLAGCLEAARLAEGATLSQIEALSRQIADSLGTVMAGTKLVEQAVSDGASLVRAEVKADADRASQAAASVEQLHATTVASLTQAVAADANRAETAANTAETTVTSAVSAASATVTTATKADADRAKGEADKAAASALQAAQSASGIKVVASEAEAAKLPVGTLYAIVPSIVASAPVSYITSNGANLNAIAFKPNLPGATTGDKVIIAVNTNAESGMTMTPPAGFATAVDGYWIGTMRFWVFTGDYAADLTTKASTTAEFGWAAVVVRGAKSVAVGEVKKREAEPIESTTTTAKALALNDGDLAISLAFERTSATETAGQVTVSPGWEKVQHTQQGVNFQSVVVAKGGTGDCVTTFPNAQSTNGAGVMVVCRAA